MTMKLQSVSIDTSGDQEAAQLLIFRIGSLPEASTKAISSALLSSLG